MQLRVKFTDDSIIIYREKWGAIFTQLAIAIVCLAIAISFYFLGADKAPPAFLIIFCGMFHVPELPCWQHYLGKAKKSSLTMAHK